LTAGGTVSYSFNITPGTDPNISWIHVALEDPAGHEIDIDQYSESSGTVSGTSTTSWINGAYTVGLIEVQDTNGYRTVYYPNGTTSYPFGGSGPSTNSIAFSALSFSFTGGISVYIDPQLSSISLTSPSALAAGGTVS
jgi:hypothetical protein